MKQKARLKNFFYYLGCWEKADFFINLFYVCVSSWNIYGYT